MRRKVVKVRTFVLNAETASMDTYQTWVTVRLTTEGLLERKSNEGGNGQTWHAMGYVSEGETQTAMLWDNDTQARQFAHVVRLMGHKCNAGGYGAAWSKAEMLKPTTNKATGRKLTAAPSIRDGSPPRDKNVKARRWNGSLSAMIAARNERASK